MKTCAEKVTVKFFEIRFISSLTVFDGFAVQKQFCLYWEAASLIKTVLHFLKLHFSWTVSPFVCEFIFCIPSDPPPPQPRPKCWTNLYCPVTLQLSLAWSFFPDWAGCCSNIIGHYSSELWIAEASTRAINPYRIYLIICKMRIFSLI